jgi:hypothetical protein
MRRSHQLFGALLFGALLVLTSTVASAAPGGNGNGNAFGLKNKGRITWSVKRVREVLAPGQSTTVSVTMTSSADLSGVELRATNGLADVVTLGTTGPIDVQAGVPVTVKLTLSLPADAVDSRAGVVKVHVDNRVIPATLKVQVKNSAASDADADEKIPASGNGNGNGHGKGKPNRP